MSNPSEIIEEARRYADSVASDATMYIGNVRSGIWAELHGILSSFPEPSEATPPEMSNLPEQPERPEYTTHELTIPDSPEPMSDLEPASLDPFGLAPIFTAEVPRFTAPAKPTQIGSFTALPPQINLVAFPEPPDELANPLLERVTLIDRVAPTAPSLNLPTLPENAPLFEGEEPSNLAERFRSDLSGERTTLSTLASAYVDQMIAKFAPGHHAGMARLEQKLNKYIEGGTALSPEVENAIYYRAQEKNDRESERVQHAAFADVAARGFTLPTGALASTLARARMEAASNNSKAASDIAIAQAEMEQRNIQFAITASSALRTTVLQMTQSWLQGILETNRQALDAAKAVMTAVIEAYNSSVKIYETRLEAWKAEVFVLESKIKLEMGKVDIYKAEITALQAAYSVDQMKIDQFKAEVSRLTAVSDLYKSRIDAVMGNVALEKAKIEIFQVQAQAYSATVQSKQAEWQAFSAEISGFEAEAKGYGARVSAFSTEVDAYKTDIEAKVAKLNGTIAKNQGTAEGYRARIQGYSALVQARSAENSAKVETEKQKSIDFKMKLDENAVRAQVEMEKFRAIAAASLEFTKAKFEAEIQQPMIKADLFKSQVALAQSEVETYSKQIEAALSGMNVLAAATETI